MMRGPVAGRSGAIPRLVVAAVREGATAARVATELLGVDLTREGVTDRLRGRCPLPGHGTQRGRKPGPFVAYDGGGWKCFGCGAGDGDGLSLYQAVKGTGFPETVRMLGELLGIAVDLPTNDYGSRPRATKPRPAVARVVVVSADPVGEWVPSAEPPTDLRHPKLGAPSRLFRVADADGRLFAVQCRFELDGGGKTYRWWRREAWGLGGAKVESAPLYGSEKLAGWDPGAAVIVTEGPKAADALRARGLHALATVCGSGTTPGAAVLAVLSGRGGPVVCWPDNDAPGRAHMDHVQASLPPGLDVRTFAPSDLPPKGDAVEWLATRAAVAPAADLLAEILIGAAKCGPAEDTAAGGDETSMPAPVRPVWQSLDDFCDAADERPDPLVGTTENCFLPAGGLVLLFGDGGSGKTTLSVDFVAHAASGTEWFGLPIARPLKILVIENEGPRAEFRGKLRKKRDGWKGRPFAHNVRVWTEPWAGLTFADKSHRQTLAEEIEAFGADVVVMGPLASLGAKGAGTPDDVTEFENLIKNFRDLCRKVFALWIVHHENKAGGVSGAWTRVPDALLHMLKQGHGRSLLKLEKMRWASESQGTSWNLCWEGGDGFRREERAQARDYRGELLEVFHDGEWHPLTQAAELIRAHPNKVRPILTDLVENGVLTYQEGAPGFARNAKCYHLAACTEAPDKSVQAVQAAIPGCS